MLELILTMIEAISEQGESSLNFTKKDIDNFVNKYNVLENKIECNEYGKLLLLKNGYISNDIFGKLMECEVKDDVFYIVVDDFNELLSKNENEAKILSGGDDFFYSDYRISNDEILTYHWDDFNEETLKEIINFCEREGVEINDEPITKENTKIEDGDIYFNDELLSDYLDDLDELSDILAYGISEAQDVADRDEIYEKIVKEVEDKIGTWEWIDSTKRVYNKEHNKYEDKPHNKIKVKLNVTYEELRDFLKEYYDKFDFDTENFGNLHLILEEMDYFDIKGPDYDHIYGNIDNGILNDIIQNKLQ